MIYTYQCPEHGEFDIMMSLRDMRVSYKCPKCGHKSPKVIALGGGIQKEDPEWIRELNPIINEGGKPLRTIKDLRQFYETHPNVRPLESHPALPSDLGDFKKPDKVAEIRERKKRAERVLREHRSLGSI
jgi:putative FmdB family regulatory protein